MTEREQFAREMMAQIDHTPALGIEIRLGAIIEVLLDIRDLLIVNSK